MEFGAGTGPRPGVRAAQPGVPAPASGRHARPNDADEYAGAAVAALYAEHALSLIRLAHIMLGNPAAAEDVVQEAFCGLYRRWPHLKDHAKALGYVRTSVINGCRTVLRRGTTTEFEDTDQPAAGSPESALLTDSAGDRQGCWTPRLRTGASTPMPGSSTCSAPFAPARQTREAWSARAC